MTTKAGSKSEVDVILRAARQNGFKTVPAQGGHKKFVDHHGKPVTDSNGPLIISSSPSDFRWREMTVKRLLAAKVLKVDPFDANPKNAAVQEKKGVSNKGRHNRLTDPDVQAKKVAAIKAKNQADQAATQKIREKFEPMVVKMGGWGAGAGGRVTQIADVAFWFNEWRGHVDRFPTQSAARSAVQSLKKGHTLSERNRKAMLFFIDELAKAEKPEERYIELLRLSKGLPPKEGDETIRGGDALPDPPTKEEREAQAAAAAAKNGKSTTPDRLLAGKPSLALQAVAEMMVGRTELSEEVLRLGEQIQDMELRERGFIT